MWTLLLMVSMGTKVMFDPYATFYTYADCEKVGDAIKRGDPTVEYRCVKNLDIPSNQ